MKKFLILIITLLMQCNLLPAQELPLQITHRGSILELKFSPDGSKLVSYSSGNQDMGVWDVRGGRLIWKRPISVIQKADEYYTLNAIAWSLDQKFIAAGGGNGSILLLEAATGKFLWRADAHRKDVTALKFTPDGKTIASVALSGRDDSVKFIRVADGSVVKTFDGDPCTGVAVAFDKTGAKFRIGNLDGNITEWNIGSEKQVNSERAAPCRVSRTYDWDRSYDDDLKISAGTITADEVAIRNELAGKILKTVKANDSKIHTTVSDDGRKVIVSEYGGFVYHDTGTLEERKLDDCVSGNAIDLNHDGSLFAQSCDGGMTAIKITDMNEGRSWFLDGHPGAVHGIIYSPDGKILAVAGHDGNIYFFDPANRLLLKTLGGRDRAVTAMAFSPDRKVLISGDERGSIRVWDVSSGKLLKETGMGDGLHMIEQLEFTRDGTQVSVLVNGSLSILAVETLEPLNNIRTREGYESRSGNMIVGYSHVPVNAAVFARDGKTMITGHSDGTIRSWDAATSEQSAMLKIGDRIILIAAVPSSDRIVALTGKKGKYYFELIDVKSMKFLRRSGNIDDGGYVKTVSVSPDGKYLAAADIIGTTLFWSFADFRFIRRLNYGYSGDDTVAFSPDGKTFFIGGKNQNLFQYETAAGKELWHWLSSFQPGKGEQKLEAERGVRVARIREIKARRAKQAAFDRAKYQGKVYITFEHYGDMSDSGLKKMMETDLPKESLVTKDAAESNAAWVRLHNDSPLPVQIPTESMYLSSSKCFHLFPNGLKMSGLCADREISVWFGVRDRNGKNVPHGFDFGSSVVLLPGATVLFPVPLNILQKGHSIVFSYSFQNVKASENDDDWDYGKEIELRFGKQNIPVKRRAKTR